VPPERCHPLRYSPEPKIAHAGKNATHTATTDDHQTMVERALPALDRRSSSRRRACRAKNSDATAKGKATSHNPDPVWDAKSKPGSGSPYRPNGIDIATLSTAVAPATYVIVVGRAPSTSGRAGLVRLVHLPPVQYRSREGFGGSGYHPRPDRGDQDISEASVHSLWRSRPPDSRNSALDARAPCRRRYSYSSAVASAFRKMMRDDRERLGLSIVRASWLLGVSVPRHRELEDGVASLPTRSRRRHRERPWEMGFHGRSRQSATTGSH
jgi:hypothetical protein